MTPGSQNSSPLAVSEQNSRRIVELICKQNYPGATFEVLAQIRGENFHARSVLTHPDGDWAQITICLPAEERPRLLELLPNCLWPWGNEERALFDGFYIPLAWVDYITLRERSD